MIISIDILYIRVILHALPVDFNVDSTAAGVAEEQYRFEPWLNLTTADKGF